MRKLILILILVFGGLFVITYSYNESLKNKEQTKTVLMGTNNSIKERRIIVEPVTPVKKHFNKNHPEMMEDEVWLTNIVAPDDKSLDGLNLNVEHQNALNAIGYKTKRVGKVAYSVYGTPMGYMVPVFVKKSEVEKNKY